MGMLKKTIQSDLVSGNTKYKNGQEKIGQVISVNKDAGTCTVSLTTRDGINSIINNVRIQFSSDGTIPWEPIAGDYVRVEEHYKRFTIIGKVDLNTLNQVKQSLYSDFYPDSTGGGCGNI
jgi:hypothetical protein